VTAACAATRHDVIATDAEPSTLALLSSGRTPIFEPGLDDLIAADVTAGRLSFRPLAEAAANADILWMAYDTPVNDDDVPDIAFARARADELRRARPDALLLLSSQIPSGFCADLQAAHEAEFGRRLRIAYSPENLRLGSALATFLDADRFVIGVDDADDRALLDELFRSFGRPIVWMSVASAEVTKHAINGFLATSISFINEIAAVCEATGADAADVERGLRSDARIGPTSYVKPGPGYAGGTLARDVQTLAMLGDRFTLPLPLLRAVSQSNDLNRAWLRRGLASEGELHGSTVAVIGLTYKGGTNTLRRSSAVELARWLLDQGAIVKAYDPAVASLAGAGIDGAVLEPTLAAVLSGASSVAIVNEVPGLRELTVADAVARMSPRPLILDAPRVLQKTFVTDPRVRYRSIGFKAAEAPEVQVTPG
jgi:UDPglucose 6-dehydrogenase